MTCSWPRLGAQPEGQNTSWQILFRNYKLCENILCSLKTATPASLASLHLKDRILLQALAILIAVDRIHEACDFVGGGAVQLLNQSLLILPEAAGGPLVGVLLLLQSEVGVSRAHAEV